MLLQNSFLLKKDDILFLAEDPGRELYIINYGKVMVFVQRGSEIIPISYLGADEYIGELSLFDGELRSASIICLEDTELTKIGTKELIEQIPEWIITIGSQLTSKIREGDQLIRTKGIRKMDQESIKPLDINEQTRCFKLIELYKSNFKENTR